MYVGDVDVQGLLRLAWELLANAIDEHLAGHATRVCISIGDDDDTIVVEDDGRGIEPEIALRAMTELHDTNTLDGHHPHVHVTPLRGLGLVIVNALSSTTTIETTHRDGRILRARFARGTLTEPFLDVGPTERRGARIASTPDREVFLSARVDVDRVQRRLEDLAACFERLALELTIAPRVVRMPRGMIDLLAARVRRDTMLHDPIHHRVTDGALTIDLALAFLRWPNGGIHTYVNGLETRAGGEHYTGFVRGLRELDLAGDDRRVHARLAGYVHVLCMAPQFTGPTGEMLANTGIRDPVEHATRAMLKRFAFYRASVVDELRASLRR